MIKTILLSLLFIKSYSLRINLALNKRAYLSSVFNDYHARYAVDGNINARSFAHAGEMFDNGSFVVDLGRPYQVEYIVLYNRYDPVCLQCTRMDNFIVDLSNNFDQRINKTLKRDNKGCGQYNGYIPPGARVELQCKDKEAYTRYVIIKQDVGKEYLTIPELEVMGEYINYVGCFKTLINNKTIESNINLTACINTCENLTFIYAAVQGRNCICGNATKHSSPLSECNVLCPGGVDYCGSPDKLSVYEVFPLKHTRRIKLKHLGCFDDDRSDRDLKDATTTDTNMTIDKCQNYCAQGNFLFFGVQYASECYCGNNYGKYGLGYTNSCSMDCRGNRGQMCGGYITNSIYAQYPQVGGSNFFKNNHHCKDGADLDLDGICGNKQCEDGWTGEDCSMRECSINNGDCGEHKCQIMNGNARVFSECICKEGFDKRFWWDYCQDTNECAEISQVCNLAISNCTNTLGSYECQCLEGGYVYDKYKNSCSRNICGPTATTVIISVASTIFIELVILGVVLIIKYRKKICQVLQRDKIVNKLQSTSEILEDDYETKAVSLSQLKSYCKENKNRLMSNFEQLPQVAEIRTTYGENVKLKHKNKYSNIIPFDCNRVVLKTLKNEELSDYINASFIPSFDGNFQFIATQGPVKETEYDFWRMILEHKVEIIVMLTSCLEKGRVKCFQYFPEGNSKNVKDINITLKSVQIWSTYEIRRFVVQQNYGTLEVTHLLYKRWLDDTNPENIGSLLNFHKKMESLHILKLTSPIVVHCSTGVGRTGTFLAMDHLLHEAQQTGMVDVFKCLKFLRSHRNYMIQTKDQFLFCFDIVLFHHEVGSTYIQLNNDMTVQQFLLEKKKRLEKEHKWISQNISISSKMQGHPKNKSRKFNIPGCVQNSVYKIHMECEMSWQNVEECCAGESNMITILVDDLIEKKLRKLPFSSKKGQLYVTDRFSHLQIKHIELASPDIHNPVYINADKTNIFAIPSNSFEQLRHLWKAVKELQVKQIALIICADDINKAGFVVCALNLLEMMDAVEEIDVFQVVYQLKSLIPHFMENVDQYRNLYSFVENCVKCNEQLYANYLQLESP